MKRFSINMTVKKIVSIMLMVLIVLSVNISASAASVTLTGPTVVRAGDTIKVNIVIAEAGRNAIEGTFSYDSKQVTLSSVTTSMSGWKVETNGNVMMAYDENMTNPTKANSVVAVATFKVNSAIAAGTNLKISLNDTVVAASSTSVDIGTVTYSVVIAQPLSTVNTLSSLTVDGYTLSPAFDSKTTSYSIGEVEYSVSKLKVNATPTDSKATVTVSGNSLSVGNNTISIVVKAENGSTKTYKITVTRKQDPDYVASNDANVSKLSVSQGTLSPVFSIDNTKYVVYLPYESKGTSFEVDGKARDSKAQKVVKGTIDSLNEGTNEAKLECVAEDGTSKFYYVTVVVMPQYEGEVPKIEGVEVTTEESTTEEVTTEEVTTKNEETTAEEITPSEDTTTAVNGTIDNAGNPDKGDGEGGVSVLVVIVIALLSACAGIGVTAAIFLSNKNNEE